MTRVLGDSILADPERCSRAEYQQAILEFESMSPDTTVIHEHEERGVRIGLYESGDTMSAIAVAPFNGFFFKLRLTLQDGREKFMVDCAWNTISTFVHLLSTKS